MSTVNPDKPQDAGLPPVIPHDFIPSYLTKVEHVKRSRFYTKEEIAQHNRTADAWVTVKNNVLNIGDLTDNTHREFLPEERQQRATLAKFAGQDVGHWFKDRHPYGLRDCVNMDKGGQREYQLPMGLIPDVLPHAPVTNYPMSKPGYRKTCWWNETSREVGKITGKMRKIKVVNMLFCSEPVHARPDLLHVCAEEKLSEILFRYLHHNRHAGSYTWKYQGRVLDMTKTLEENGLHDDEAELKYLNIDVDEYIPILHVYFNDDLTVA